MIKTEIKIINNKQFIRTWSDENRYIIRDSIQYTEAWDPAEFKRNYIEGDLIPEEEVENV